MGGLRHLLARPEHLDGPEGATAQRVDVEAALRSLPPRQRACVVLRFYDDLTVPEIASRLGVADGSVKRYLSLGVHRIEALLGPVLSLAAAEAADTVETHESVLLHGGEPS